jgi:hypothetical protein
MSNFYDIARNFADYTKSSLFLTGKAGTGKTTFLRNLKEESKKEMAIVAPTGVAAINAGGVTIHSFFQLPFTPFVPTEEGRKDLISKMKINSARRKVWYELELLVIDEISMVRADVLDAIDTVLRHFRYRRSEPFGGVQVIFIGDMYQLSPVYRDDERAILSAYYPSMYFFDSLAIREQMPVYIEFDKIFRQSNPEFIELLNEVRNNNISEKSFAILQSLYKPDFKIPKDDTYITLTTHNYKADSINAEELAKLKGKEEKFKAEIKGDYPEKSYPTEEELKFKVGAKVMFLKNDKETPRRFFNGKIGEITEISDEVIIVKCPEDEDTITVMPEIWENVSYSTNPETKQIEETILGTFKQFPLRLAWAITIHKSQGLTFDKAVIDAGQAFAPGQVYVALSRCRSLEGMVLLSQLNRNSLQIDQNIIEHSKQKQPIENLNAQLEEDKRKYRLQTMFSLFDFKTVVGQCHQLIEFVKEKITSFNDETLPFLISVFEKLQNIQTIAQKFQNELQRIMFTSPIDEIKLQERITLAIDYFSAQLNTLSEELKQSPASTDSKINAKDYNDDFKTVFNSLEEKLHIFKNVREKFTVEQYYIAKNTLILPVFSVNAYAGSENQAKKTTAKYPALYYKLYDLRRKICDSANIPVFLVASTKGLAELATYLPYTLDEMKKLSGFGETNVAKFGQQFLDVVLEYCEKNSLESLMHEKITAQKGSKKAKEKEKKEKAEKPQEEPKTPSKEITLALYQEGKTIEEIASERNLAVSTISSHLAEFIGNEVDIDEFISEERRKEAQQILDDKTDETVSDYQTLKGKFSQIELAFFWAWKR